MWCQNVLLTAEWRKLSHLCFIWTLLNSGVPFPSTIFSSSIHYSPMLFSFMGVGNKIWRRFCVLASGISFSEPLVALYWRYTFPVFYMRERELSHIKTCGWVHEHTNFVFKLFKPSMLCWLVSWNNWRTRQNMSESMRKSVGTWCLDCHPQEMLNPISWATKRKFQKIILLFLESILPETNASTYSLCNCCTKMKGDCYRVCLLSE